MDAPIKPPFEQRAHELLKSLGLPPSGGCVLAVLISERPEEARRAMAERHPTRESMLGALRGTLLDADPEQFIADFFLALPEWPVVTRIRESEEATK